MKMEWLIKGGRFGCEAGNGIMEWEEG